MTREEKLENIQSVNYEISKAQGYLEKAAERLEEKGMQRDATQLMNIVYRLGDMDRKYL